MVHGDANQREVLEQAGVARARNLVLTASGSGDAVEAIRLAREINPHIHVVVRADYLAQTSQLKAAGAGEVFAGEGELALAMTESILRRLGGSEERLSSEREWVRRELDRAV